MTEIVSITQNQTVLASELHKSLQSKKHFSEWVKRYILDEKWGFIEGEDFHQMVNVASNRPQGGGSKITDYELSIDCAKEIAMVQRTEKGKTIRQYLIQCEKQLKQIQTPQLTQAELILKIAENSVAIERKQKELENRVAQLESKPSETFTSARAYKASLKVKKDDLGNEINSHIRRIYMEGYGITDYSAANRRAWAEYERDTGNIYTGAKTASYESKAEYLNWLKNQATPIYV